MIKTDELGRDSRAICERLDELIELHRPKTVKADDNTQSEAPAPKDAKPLSTSNLNTKKEL